MISEPQQEQAALYSLGSLDADEAAAFERHLAVEPDLRDLVRGLQESAALLAFTSNDPGTVPPPALRGRVLAAHSGARYHRTVSARSAWLPWTLAALLAGCSALSLWIAHVQRGKLADLQSALSTESVLLTQTKTPRVLADPFAHVSFCALEPTPDFATAQPRAAVLWDAVHRQGKLRVNRLAPAAEGKDYQLWVVESGRKETVSAGLVHLDAAGQADLPFQPADMDGKPVVAVAISLEQAGGSPTNRGPILLLGKL